MQPIKILNKNLEHLFNSLGTKTKFRIDEPNLWDDLLLNCSYQLISYSHQSIDFQFAYQKGHGGDWEDLSVIIFWDNKPVALWPLSVSRREGITLISSHGQPILPPFFPNSIKPKIQKQINKNCLDIVEILAKELGIDNLESSYSYNGLHSISNWHTQSMKRGAKCNVLHELYVDLQEDLSIIRSNFRSSYKSLINSGLRIWGVNVLYLADESIWREFRKLHLEVSGRITRSDETWKLQLSNIAEGKALLIYLNDDKGKMVGGGFFDFTRDEALYSVAAYDRSLFDKPLGHVVQYRAIEEFKKRGLKWYKIGVRPYPADLNSPTDKEISIGEFKEGFATHISPKFHLIHKKSPE